VTVTVGLRFTSGGQQELQAAADKGSEALRKLGETAKRSNDESRRAAQQYTDTLRRQADTLGMSRSQVMAYEAAQHKLTDAQRQSVQASIASIDAYDKKTAMLGRIRVAAAAAGTALTVAFVAGLKSSITAAAEAEQAQLRLEAVLRGTGYTAGFTGAELDKMAGKFQDRLGIDDETVKKSMATLLTFRQVRRESFSEALEVAANISAVMGSDLQSATLQLGKALENPEQGLTALTRSGVSFNETQKAMITEMVETGRHAEAVTTILQVMKSQGLDRVAESMHSGINKQTSDLKNVWGDLLEAIGKTDAVGGSAQRVLNNIKLQLKTVKDAVEADNWLDRLDILFSTPGIVTTRMRNRQANEAALAGADGAGERYAMRLGEERKARDAAREQVTTFLGAFKSDNDKLADEVRKFRALAGNAGLTAAETDAGVAKIQAKYAKKGAKESSAGAQLVMSLTEQLQQAAGEATVFDKVMRQVTSGVQKFSEAEVAAALSLAGEIDERKRLRAELDQSVAAYDREEAKRKASAATIAGLNESISLQAQGLQLEIDMMGASEAQREKVIALRELENKFIKARIGLDGEALARSYEMERIERERISGLLDQRGQAQARKKALEDAKAEQTRFNDDLARGLTDSIFRGFEGGKSFARNFWDSMKNMAKTTILQPVVKFLVSPITSAVGGALGAILPGTAGASSHIMGGGIGGGIGQGLGGLGNLGSLFSGDGLSALAGIPNAMFQNAGVSMGSQFIADIGNFGFGAPVMGGVMNLLAGNVKGAVGSAALGTLGTMFGGPIGGAIGSVVGGLFGGSKKTPAYFTSADVSAVANAQGGYVSSATANSQKGDRWSFNYDLASVIQGSIRDLYKEIDTLGTRLGRDTSALWTSQIPFSFKAGGDMVGPTIEGAVAGFQESLGQLSDQLVRTVVPNLSDFAQAGESATQTLTRMIMMQEQAQAQLTGAVRNLPGALGITSLEGTRNALAMSEYVSPIDRLSTARSLLTDTYNRGLAGDLTAVSSYGSQLQQALTLGREVGASGPAFQALFQEGNRQLNDLLARQQQIQTEMLQDIDVSILQASQDQIAELKRGFKAMVDALDALRGDVRRMAA
jgi:hypothetical protein